jgi:hypothetical protein
MPRANASVRRPAGVDADPTIRQPCAASPADGELRDIAGPCLLFARDADRPPRETGSLST